MFVRLNRFKDGPLMRHAHFEDAGWDVYAKNGLIVYPGQTRKISLGFGVEIPRGFMGLLMPRTSLAEEGLVVHQCPIDSGYLGELFAIVTNTSEYTIERDEDVAIAQLVFVQVAEPAWTYGPCNHMWNNHKDKAFLPRAKGPRLIGAFGSTDPGAVLVEDGEDEEPIERDAGAVIAEVLSETN
jgi:dUTP pyrophosphatase